MMGIGESEHQAKRAVERTPSLTQAERLSRSPQAERPPLPPHWNKIMKKTLFYHLDHNSNTKDHDIFVVSWDVDKLPEPPDDISPLLPPESWGEPDIICLGLQRCAPAAAPLWSLVVTSSIHRYSQRFVPVASEAPYDELSGSLILVYIREDIKPYMHGYSAELRGTDQVPVAAVRFCLHQTSICFVCSKIETQEELARWRNTFTQAAAAHITQNGFTYSQPFAADPSGQKNPDMEAVHTALAWEALTRQKFSNFATRLQFDVEGKAFTIEEHPLVIWIGLKDSELKGLCDDRALWSSYLVAADSSKVIESITPPDPMMMLRPHKLDVRFSNRVPLAPQRTRLFGSSSTMLSKPARGSVHVLKAGLMRLVLEIVDGDGVPTPSEAIPELVLIRAALPTAEVGKMKALHDRLAASLELAVPSDLPAVVVNTPQVTLPPVLYPWEPVCVSFKLRNPHPTLPAPFTIFCFNETGKSVSPVARHSFLHQAKLSSGANQTILSPSPSKQNDSPLRAGGLDDNGSTTARIEGDKDSVSGQRLRSKKSKTEEPNRKAKKSSSWLPKATIGTGQSASFFRGFLGATSSKKKKTQKDEATASSSALLEPKVSNSEMLLATSAPVATTTLAPVMPSPENPQPSPRNLPYFSLSKWILIEPTEGVLLSGEEVTINVNLMILEGFTSWMKKVDPVVFVIRVDGCHKETYVTLDPEKISPSMLGLNAADLTEHYSTAPILRGNSKTKVDTENEPQSNEGDFLLRTPRKTFNPSFSPRPVVQEQEALPLPKEIYHILTFVRNKLIYSLDPKNASLPKSWRDAEYAIQARDWFCLPLFLIKASRGWRQGDPRIRRDMMSITQALLQHEAIPPTLCLDAALRVLEQWMLSTPLPLVPREYITDLEQCDGGDQPGHSGQHFLCRAVLLSLPTLSRNVWLSFASLLRELIMFHMITAESALQGALTRFAETNGQTLGPCPDIPGGAEALADSEKCLLAKTKINRTTLTFMIDAVSQWTARLIARDTPVPMGVAFVQHFLHMNTSPTSWTS